MRTTKTIYIILLSIYLIGLLISCDDNSNTTSNTGASRNIYFTVDKSSNSKAFYSYSINTNTLSQFFNNQSINGFSNISDNNNVVFTYNTLFDSKIVCLKNGKEIIEIPLPTVAEPEYGYYIHIYPNVALSQNGQVAAFFLRYAKISNPADFLDSKLFLATVNLNSLIMNWIEVPVSDLGKQISEQVNSVIPDGDNILINNDGTKIFFLICGCKISNTTFKNLGYIISEYSNGKFANLTPNILPVSLTLNYYDKYSNLLLLSYVDSTYTLNLEKKYFDINPGLDAKYIHNTYQFSYSDIEMVQWTDYGIELFYPSNGHFIKHVISKQEIAASFPDYNLDPKGRIALSSDCKVIVFGLAKNINQDIYDIFMVNRDGTELKRIEIGLPITNIAISN